MYRRVGGHCEVTNSTEGRQKGKENITHQCERNCGKDKQSYISIALALVVGSWRRRRVEGYMLRSTAIG